ncbi:MAG: 4Fe-4S binding protein [Proteobacteria bacterium]|nr:4Fe-4S binding protein [Pseudomonadota bacterium]
MVKSFLLAFPMMVLTFVMLSGGKMSDDPAKMFAFAITFLFVNILFFLMIRTGKTDKYRSILFISYAVCFIISFITHLIELRGSMAISEANMLDGRTPFCHIVIPMTLIPAALTKTIIFPGTIIGSFASIASMFVLWIGASLALGRGFCSWACFFGGLDDGFSRIFKKPLIKNINLKWTYLPYAVLFVVVVTAALTLSPTYCEWLCPYKTVTEFAEVTSVKILMQTIIFVSLFIALVIVLPLLTKRRTQCGLFCPFGAFQSFTNKVNAFEVRIDQEKCVKCKRCLQVCPTFSVDEGSIDEGKMRITCTKCGKCVDACPKKAIFFHVKCTPLNSTFDRYRVLFLYPAFLFLTTMAGGNIQDAIVKTIKLLTTGSMF